jgi:hypothetical protein
MDPLSATASVIALVQATVAIAKGVQFIRSLGDIPLEFAQLCNELTTLQAVAEQVKSTLKDVESHPQPQNVPSPDTAIITSLVDDLGQTTKKLDDLCERLKVSKKKTVKTGNGKDRISKFRWQREKENVARLQRQARTTRQYLSLCFTAFNSSQA